MNRGGEKGVPPKLHGHVSGFPNGDLLEGFNGEHEMLLRRVAMSAAALSVETVVRGAEIGGGDDDGGAGDAPPPVEGGFLLQAAELEARTADLAAAEQCLT